MIFSLKRCLDCYYRSGTRHTKEPHTPAASISVFKAGVFTSVSGRGYVTDSKDISCEWLSSVSRPQAK